MAVTLVVKTPSLKLSDLTYCCDSKSTVHQLKVFLQEQYPSKPKPEEQRLIYQGRLLRDNEVLQDFLRDLDNEQRHTLHLVYTLKRSPSAENQLAGVPPAPTTAANNNAYDDGLRQRHTNTAQRSATTPTSAAPFPQQPPAEWVTNGQFPTGLDPLTQQMMWWQHNYAQQYWAQYMQQFSQHQLAQVTSSPLPANPVQPTQEMERARQEQQQPVIQPEQQQQQPQRRQPPMAAVGGVAQDEDEDGGIRAARDWLDWIYVGSRLAILLGVMYYYSSLPRFMLVTLIVAGIYLYQKAIHQRRVHVVPQPVIAQPRPAEVNNNVGQAPVPVTPEVPPPAPAEEDERVEPAAQLPADAEVNADVNAITPTVFNVALNVLIGFFTSLIPEVPAPEALN